MNKEKQDKQLYQSIGDKLRLCNELLCAAASECDEIDRRISNKFNTILNELSSLKNSLDVMYYANVPDAEGSKSPFYGGREKKI